MKKHSLTESIQNSDILKAVLDSVGDAVSIQDADLKVLYQNDAHRKLIGDHVGEFCYKGFQRRDAACEGCPVLKALKDGASHSAVRNGNGEHGVVFVEITASPIKDKDGNVIAGIELARNVTGRVKTDRELRELKEMLEDIAHGVTDSILLLSRDFRILWANEAASRQCGLSKDELAGNFCYKVTHGRDSSCEPPHDPCPVSELLQTGRPVTVEHEHHDKDGNPLYVEVTAYPVVDNTGEIVRFVHIAKDITERKKHEQEREKLIHEREDALDEIRTLKGIIPICSACKNIRNDSGYWEQIEAYISKHSDAEFSHGLCPNCTKKLYPDYSKDRE